MIQKPITEDMTPERLDKYNKMVHDEQLGNTPNPWPNMPYVWGGKSYHVTQKPMSDELKCDSNRSNKAEEIESLNVCQNKTKLIEKWKQSIKKLTAQIEEIKADQTLAEDDRQRKIARRTEIINNYKQSIKRETEFIQSQRNMMREVYEKHMKQK